MLPPKENCSSGCQELTSSNRSGSRLRPVAPVLQQKDCTSAWTNLPPDNGCLYDLAAVIGQGLRLYIVHKKLRGRAESASWELDRLDLPEECSCTRPAM